MYRILLSSLLFVLFCLGCQQEPAELPSIRLGHALHDHHATLFVAAQMPDYFRQHGDLYLQEVEHRKHYRLVEKGKPIADVQLQPGTGGGQLIRKLHEQQIDVALGGVPAMIKQIDAGSPLKIVAPMMSEGAALVLAKDFPADDWASFIEVAKQTEKPIRIGYKIQTSVQNLIFEQALLSEGVSFSKEHPEAGKAVVVRNMFGATNLIPALQNDLIDGFVIMQPFAALAEYQQVGKAVASLSDLPPKSQWQDHPCCALAANGLLLEQKRELLSKLVLLLLRANRYLQQQPEKSAALVAKWLERPVAVEQLSLPTINFLANYSDQWHSGVEFWISSMDQQGKMTGTLKAALDKGTLKDLLYDMRIYEQARAQLEQE